MESSDDALEPDTNENVRGSTESVENPCSVCLARDKRDIDSVKYCTACDYYLCAACTDWHAEFPPMAQHQVVDVSKTMLLPRQQCQEHDGRILEKFCPTHDQLACDVCARTHHKKCHSLQYIPKIAVGIKQSQEFATVTRHTKTLLKGLKELKATHMAYLDTINMEEAENQSIIEEQGRKLHKRVDELIENEYDKLAREYQSKRDPIRNDMTAVENQIRAVEDSDTKLSDFKEDNESELFVIMKQAKKHEEDGKQFLNELSPTILTLPRYKLDMTVEKALGGVKSLGHFGQRVTMLQKSEHGVRTRSDTEVCFIGDVCLLVDGSLVVTDFTNRSLKHLDDKNVNKLDLETEPGCVCGTSCHAEVAVSLLAKKMIQFVSIGNRMKMTRSFSIGEACRGMCFSNGELFLCCGSVYDWTGGSIRVFDEHGSFLRKIGLDQMGQHLFGIPQRIAVSPDNMQLHVSDKVKGVLTVDRAGSLLAQYSDLADPCGICTITGGDLLVSCLSSDNVIHITSSCRKVGNVLLRKDGIAGPASLCYDESNSRLIICTKESDTLTIVDLLVD